MKPKFKESKCFIYLSFPNLEFTFPLCNFSICVLNLCNFTPKGKTHCRKTQMTLSASVLFTLTSSQRNSKNPKKTPVSKRSSFSPMSPLVFHYHSSHLDGKKNTHMLLTPTWQQQPRWPNVHVKPGWRLASCVASAQLPAAITKRKYLMSQTLELLIRSDSLSSPVPPMNPRARLGKRARALKPRPALPQRAGQDRTSTGQDRTIPARKRVTPSKRSKSTECYLEAQTQTC